MFQISRIAIMGVSLFLPFGVTTQAAPARAFFPATGLLFQIPDENQSTGPGRNKWVEVDDVTMTCRLLDTATENPQGLNLTDPVSGESLWITNWGVLYRKTASTWAAVSRGTWLDSPNHLGG